MRFRRPRHRHQNELARLAVEVARLRNENGRLREEIQGWEVFANGSLRREREARYLVGVAYPLMRPEEMR
jgi:hypothetical protein